METWPVDRCLASGMRKRQPFYKGKSARPLTRGGERGGSETKMLLSKEGLDAIERAADKRKSANTLLLVQVLREVRELSALLKQQNYTGYSGNDGTNRTCNCDEQQE